MKSGIRGSLLGLMTLAVAAVVVERGVFVQVGMSGQAVITIYFAWVVLLLDGAWLVYFLRQSHAELTNQTLLRLQPLIAWLIYHTAAVPLFLLTDRFQELSVTSWLLVQAALLLMGLVPVVSMVWLDYYLQKKIK